jgi:hypothetical protein
VRIEHPGAVVHEILDRAVRWNALAQLLSGPRRGRVLGRSDVKNPARLDGA